MGSFGPRPSRAQSIFIAVMATALMVFGIFQLAAGGESPWFMAAWVVIGVGIVATALLSAKRNRATASAPTVRLSKPGAVIGAVGGVAVLVVGLVNVDFDGPFVFLWVGFVVAIIAFNLWSAFRRQGAS